MGLSAGHSVTCFLLLLSPANISLTELQLHIAWHSLWLHGALEASKARPWQLSKRGPSKTSPGHPALFTGLPLHSIFFSASQL